jgi:hypothetical protein
MVAISAGVKNLSACSFLSRSISKAWRPASHRRLGLGLLLLFLVSPGLQASSNNPAESVVKPNALRESRLFIKLLSD